MDSRADRWQLAIWAVALLVLAFAAFRWFGGSGDAAGRAPPVRIEDGRNEEEASGRVFVHVAGAVRRPGLYRVASSARVGVAVARAGGISRRADLTRINLAAKVSDGQQVIVPARGKTVAAAPTAGTPGAGGATPGAPPGATISLATATLEQLDSLDGIGPTLARRILEHRDRIGGFKSVEQLREVDGIGDKRFESLREALGP